MSHLPAIGFIGLGIMGKPMARNLLKAGFSLSVSSRSKEKMDELAREGAHPCHDYSELVGRSEVIITMLPDYQEVRDVVLGPRGIRPYLRPGMIVIDMSSIDPTVSIEISKQLAERSVHFLDAPVSGGEQGAIDGSLAIMIGGDADPVQKCMPIFEALGKNIVHVGPVGAGGFTKLANQIIVALNIAAVGEAFVLAQKAGLDVQKVYEAIRGGLAGSRVLDAKAPKLFQRDFKPGFRIELHRKDLKNAMEAAKNLQIALPLTASLQQYLTALCNQGEGSLDHGGIVRFFERLNGIEIGKKV
jgi:2-hydroxy-3-oxopropionate reductase